MWFYFKCLQWMFKVWSFSIISPGIFHYSKRGRYGNLFLIAIHLPLLDIIIKNIAKGLEMTLHN